MIGNKYGAYRDGKTCVLGAGGGGGGRVTQIQTFSERQSENGALLQLKDTKARNE